MVVSSSDNFTGGMKYSRFSGPVFSGQVETAGPVGGPLPAPGAIAVLQTTAALLTQLVTTTAQLANSSVEYITQGTVSITSSNTANVSASPPYTGMGAALYYDTTRKKLSIFSTVLGDWVSVTLSSS